MSRLNSSIEGILNLEAMTKKCFTKSFAKVKEKHPY